MMLTGADIAAFFVTMKLAVCSMIILMAIGAPLAWWLAHARTAFKPAIEAVVALPLILPPTVLGFYLLVALAPDGPVGGSLGAIGVGPLAFTFEGLVIGSVLYSLPFVVQPLQDAFTLIGAGPLEAAATLRAGPLDRFFTIAVPQARVGFITAGTLGFAHTVGEFGVVLMIGGNIPSETQTLSIAIYDHVEALEYGGAYALSGALLIFSFLLLLAVYILNRRFRVAGP